MKIQSLSYTSCISSARRHLWLVATHNGWNRGGTFTSPQKVQLDSTSLEYHSLIYSFVQQMLPGTLSYARLYIRPWISGYSPGSASALGRAAGGHSNLEVGPACWLSGLAPVVDGAWADFLKKQHLHDCFLLVPPRSSPDKADGSRKDISEAGITVKASVWLPAIASQIGVPSWLVTNCFLLLIILLWEVDYPLKNNLACFYSLFLIYFF